MYILTTADGANLPASASLEGFPLLVRINGDFLDFSQCKADGADIRFSAEDGAPLPFRIEEWDSAGRSAAIWVRIPRIAGNARQVLRIHWGNPGAEAASDGKAVFHATNGFCSVWHMDGTVADDTGSVESKDEGTSPTRGIVGEARHLAGGQGVFAGSDIATYPKGMGPMSTSAWFRADRVNGTVVAWGKEKRPAKVMMNFLSPPRIAIQCYFADVQAERALATGEWYHVVHTYSPKDSRVYINGVLDGKSTPELDIPETSALWIGGWYGNYNFVGDVDEVRIASVARSADWVRLEYENQKPMQTAVGPIVRDGSEFALGDDAITLDEGARATVRARIGGANSHLAEIGELPLGKGLRVFDRVELVVVLRAGRRRERSFPARDEILGRERRAIAPLRIGPQVERVGFSIRRNLPTLRHARHRLSILVVGAESLEKRIHDAALRLARDDRRVQRFRLRAVHKNQIPSRGILPARGQREGENCHANQSCSS